MHGPCHIARATHPNTHEPRPSQADPRPSHARATPENKTEASPIGPRLRWRAPSCPRSRTGDSRRRTMRFQACSRSMVGGSVSGAGGVGWRSTPFGSCPVNSHFPSPVSPHLPPLHPRRTAGRWQRRRGGQGRGARWLLRRAARLRSQTLVAASGVSGVGGESLPGER